MLDEAAHRVEEHALVHDVLQRLSRPRLRPETITRFRLPLQDHLERAQSLYRLSGAVHTARQHLPGAILKHTIVSACLELDNPAGIHCSVSAADHPDPVLLGADGGATPVVQPSGADQAHRVGRGRPRRVAVPECVGPGGEHPVEVRHDAVQPHPVFGGFVELHVTVQNSALTPPERTGIPALGLALAIIQRLVVRLVRGYQALHVKRCVAHSCPSGMLLLKTGLGEWAIYPRICFIMRKQETRIIRKSTVFRNRKGPIDRVSMGPDPVCRNPIPPRGRSPCATPSRRSPGRSPGPPCSACPRRPCSNPVP